MSVVLHVALLAPALLGQVRSIPVGGAGGGVPPVIVTNPGGAGGLTGGSGLAPDLRPSFTVTPTPQLTIDGTNNGSAAAPASGHDQPVAARDDAAKYGSVATSDGITPPPPNVLEEPPPDGGDEDDDGETKRDKPWSVIVLLVVVGLVSLGMMQSRGR